MCRNKYIDIKHMNNGIYVYKYGNTEQCTGPDTAKKPEEEMHISL